MKQSCPKTCPSINHPEAGFYRNFCKAGESVSIKPSDVHCLVFVMYGSCVIDSSERNNYTVAEKHFFFCYRDFSYEIRAVSDVEIIVAYFANLGAACDLTSLAQTYNQKQKTFKYEFAAVAFNEPLRELLQPLHRFLQDGIRCGHIHNSMIETLFGVFRFYYTVNVQIKLFYNLFGQDISFRTLVENNRPKARNLNHLAELCGYGRREFNHIFHKYFAEENLTPHVWMQEQRKHDVLKDIEETDMAFGFIAEKHHFSNLTRLGIFCKQYLGDTPSNLRKKSQQKQNGE